MKFCSRDELALLPAGTLYFEPDYLSGFPRRPLIKGETLRALDDWFIDGGLVPDCHPDNGPGDVLWPGSERDGGIGCNQFKFAVPDAEEAAYMLGLLAGCAQLKKGTPA